VRLPGFEPSGCKHKHYVITVAGAVLEFSGEAPASRLTCESITSRHHEQGRENREGEAGSQAGVA